MSFQHPLAFGDAPPHDHRGDAAWRLLHRRSTAPYRGVGRFAWHFARGKLGRDPAFRHLLEEGALAGRARMVDIGCGQGLLASLMQACRDLQAEGAWPQGWQPAPAVQQYTGIELMSGDVRRAQQACAGLALAPQFVCADMRDAPLPACDAVVILDVLHYIDHAAQAQLLQRVRDALAPGGRLLVRVGDMADRRAFAISQWVDRIVTAIHGHRVPPTWGRSVAQWSALLQQLGFSVRATPMSAGTPFANVLLLADLQGSVP